MKYALIAGSTIVYVHTVLLVKGSIYHFWAGCCRAYHIIGPKLLQQKAMSGHIYLSILNSKMAISKLSYVLMAISSRNYLKNLKKIMQVPIVS